MLGPDYSLDEERVSCDSSALGAPAVADECTETNQESTGHVWGATDGVK